MTASTRDANPTNRSRKPQPQMAEWFSPRPREVGHKRTERTRCPRVHVTPTPPTDRENLSRRWLNGFRLDRERLVTSARTLRSCPLRRAAVEPGRVGPLLAMSTLGAEISKG